MSCMIEYISTYKAPPPTHTHTHTSLAHFHSLEPEFFFPSFSYAQFVDSFFVCDSVRLPFSRNS